MAMDSIKIFAPATVANVACGFDIFGFALEEPGDVLRITRSEGDGIVISNRVEGLQLPLDPESNTAGIAVAKMLQSMNTKAAISIDLIKKINPGSGIGSSAASAAAAVFGVNELFGRPYTTIQLVEFAMYGEIAASGSPHADNVAPSLIGGFVLVRGCDPLDVYSISVPDNLYCAVVHPQVTVNTAEARAMLKKEILLRDAVTQWGNAAGLVAGMYSANYELIANSLHDVVAEPARATLIPEFHKVKEAAMQAGALGCSISGSGPSMFALCKGMSTARKASEAMSNTFTKNNIANHAYTSSVNAGGARILN